MIKKNKRVQKAAIKIIQQPRENVLQQKIWYSATSLVDQKDMR